MIAQEIKALMEKVLENNRRLDACPRHEFERTDAATHYGDAYRCVHCEGTLDASGVYWYQAGLRHGTVPSAQPYAHRNGEATDPAVDGWYWCVWKDRDGTMDDPIPIEWFKGHWCTAVGTPVTDTWIKPDAIYGPIPFPVPTGQPAPVQQTTLVILETQLNTRLPAHGALREIIEQLVACQYWCEAGPLENNVAFRELILLALRGSQ